MVANRKLDKYQDGTLEIVVIATMIPSSASDGH
jgi:hypothetical protein